MRLEELANGNFIKVPDKTESDMLNVINRFFTTDMEGIENSREAIIQEVQRRMKPLVINLIKRFAWEEGRDIFEPMIEGLVDQIMSSEIDKIMAAVEELKKTTVKNLTSHITATLGESIFLLPQDTVKYNRDAIRIDVNGMRQIEDVNYTVTYDDATKYCTSIVFVDPLENNDELLIDCMIYSTSTGTNIGGTP